MRRSKAEAAQTRERIVATAARAFRAHGINGIGVADLMREAGLTHGGFYKHFPSKEALVAEACAQALTQSCGGLAEIARRAPAGRKLAAVVEAYLSAQHRDHPENGCAIAALGAEAARAEAAARQAIGDGLERLRAVVAEQLVVDSPEEAAAKAGAIVSAMIGALTVARLETDPARSEAVLAQARAFILASVGPGGSK